MADWQRKHEMIGMEYLHHAIVVTAGGGTSGRQDRTRKKILLQRNKNTCKGRSDPYT